MNLCRRCHRRHSGVCGISPRVTMQFRIGIGGLGGSIRQYLNPGTESRYYWRPKKVSPKKIDTHILEKLLEEGRAHYKKVIEMLKVIPPSEPVYAELLDKESKLKSIINQILGQIAIKK